MTAATKPKQNPVYDPAKLESMTEPLTVTVDKVKGNTRLQIPLPVGQNETGGASAPGTGWAKDDVRNLMTWLVNEWSGGGFYDISVFDDSKPQPLTMRWTYFYEPTIFPERVPPPLAGNATPGAYAGPQLVQQQLPPASPPQRGLMSAFPNGLPTNPFPVSAPAPQPQYAPQPFYYPAPQGTFPGYAPQQQQQYDPRFAQMEATNRELASQLERARMDAIQARHDQAIAAQREQARAETARLEAKITELAQALTQGNTSRANDPQMEILREQNRQREEENRRLMEKADNDRRERELRDLMRANADATQRQIEAMQTNFTSMVNAIKEQGRGHDPLIAMFQENQRSQMDAMKEIARGNQTSIERMQQFMLNPKDVAALVKDSSQGVDTVSQQVSRAFTNVLDVQGRLMQQMVEMNQGGESVPTMIKDGLERAMDMGKRWIGAKSKQAIEAQRAQASMAQSQAQALTAQAIVAQSQQQQREIVPPLPPPPPAPAVIAIPTMITQQMRGQLAGLGYTVEQIGLFTPIQAHEILLAGQRPMPAAPASGMSGLNGTGTNGLPRPINPTNNHNARNEPTHLGRTDAQWFGPLVGEVLKLRAGVARCIESVSMDPPRMDKATNRVDGVEPEQAANYLMQAVVVVNKQQIVVPAMIDLLMQQRFSDFIDVILPDAPQGYKAEVIQALVKELEGGEDEEEDEEEDGDDDDDGDDTKLEERSAPRLVKSTNAQA